MFSRARSGDRLVRKVIVAFVNYVLHSHCDLPLRRGEKEKMKLKSKAWVIRTGLSIKQMMKACRNPVVDDSTFRKCLLMDVN